MLKTSANSKEFSKSRRIVRGPFEIYCGDPRALADIEHSMRR